MNEDAQTGYIAQSEGQLRGMDPDLERACFELDRVVVLDQIDEVHRTIVQNIEELAMVAHEGVFERGVSDQITRAARSLRAISQQLAGLRGEVAKTDGHRRATRVRPRQRDNR